MQIQRADTTQKPDRIFNSVSVNYLVALGHEIELLDGHLKKFVLNYVAAYSSLVVNIERESGKNPETENIEAIAELGRMTSRILIDIRKKQELIKKYAEQLEESGFAFAPQAPALCKHQQTACIKYFDLLKQTSEQITAFSRCTGNSLDIANTTRGKHEQSRLIKEFMLFLGRVSGKLSMFNEVVREPHRFVPQNQYV